MLLTRLDVTTGIWTFQLRLPSFEAMEVTLSADLQARLDRFCLETGRSASEVIADALAGYFEGLEAIRETLDRRYDEIETGRVRMIPGDEVVARFKAKSAAFRAARERSGEVEATSDTRE